MFVSSCKFSFQIARHSSDVR